MQFLTNNYMTACKNALELRPDSPPGTDISIMTPIKETDRYQVFSSISGHLWGKKKGKPDYFWIPRIEDTIQLVRMKRFAQIGQLNDLKLDVHMRVIISKLYCYSGCAALTFSEMWLIFYMHEAFKKQWIFGREEWEAL